MNLTRKILVPLDLSRNSELVVETVEQLCSCKPEKIYLMHVIEAKLVERPVAGFDASKLVKELEKQAMEKLEEYKKRLESRGASVEILEVEVGDPAEEIVIAATKVSANMIVMGYKGKGFLKRKLLGSVADEVLEACAKPVLIVKWVEASRMKSLSPIIATVKLGDPLDEKIIAYGEELAKALGSKLILFHVMMDGEDRRRVEEELGSIAGAIASRGVDVEAIVWSGTPWVEILNAAKSVDAGLIIVGNDECREKIDFKDILFDFIRGSTVENVVRRALSSVLVVI